MQASLLLASQIREKGKLVLQTSIYLRRRLKSHRITLSLEETILMEAAASTRRRKQIPKLAKRVFLLNNSSNLPRKLLLRLTLTTLLMNKSD